MYIYTNYSNYIIQTDKKKSTSVHVAVKRADETILLKYQKIYNPVAENTLFAYYLIGAKVYSVKYSEYMSE